MMSQKQYSGMRQCHGKDILFDCPIIQGDLGVILKKSHQHTVIGTALAFQMVFLCFFSFYLETGISNTFLFISALLVQKVFIW